MKKRPVIFLDFDGVIRLYGVAGAAGASFCPDRMAALAALAGELGADVVVTSDWRYDPSQRRPVCIRGCLSPDLEGRLHADDATPFLGSRWREVSAWLVAHPDAGDYVILEDWERHFEFAPPGMKERLLLCCSRFGIVPQILDRIRERLGPG